MTFPTTGVLDNFNRTDALLTDSGNWDYHDSSAMNSGVQGKVLSNVVGPSDMAFWTSYWSAASYGPDAEVFATLATLSNNGSPHLLGLRITNPGTGGAGGTNGNNYRAYFTPQVTSHELTYVRYDAGVETQLGSTETPGNLAAGAQIGLQIIGSTLQAYADTGSGWTTYGTSRTDGTYTGAGYVGTGCGDDTGRLDDFGGGTVVTAAPFTTRQSTLRGGDVLRGVAPAGGPLTVVLGQATETDLAQAMTHGKQKGIGQATSTETAQAITARKARAIGQVSETDQAQALAVNPKRRLITQATETDLAQALTHGKRKAVGPPVETDQAQPVTVRKQRALGQAVETDLAQTLTHRKTRALGQASETDLAQPLTVRKTVAIGLAAETDLAQPVTRLSAGQIVPVQQVVETDLAQPVMVNPRRRLVGQASETDQAQAVAHGKQRTLAQAGETDLAQPITARKLRLINLVTETGTAQPLVRVKVRGLAMAVETDEAQPVAKSKRVTLGLCEEIDVALPLVFVVYLVGYIRAVQIVAALPTARFIFAALPSATAISGSCSSARSVTGRLPVAEAITGRLPTATDIVGVR